MSPNLSLKHLEAKPSKEFSHCNRTLRYHNPALNYRFLKGRQNVMFVGMKEEHHEFQKEVGPTPFLHARDFLELAQWIAGCKLFIGNQSACWQLAEATKATRLLEVYPSHPNGVPHGSNSYEAWAQELFEHWVNELAK